jgi:hypothetical protein
VYAVNIPLTKVSKFPILVLTIFLIALIIKKEYSPVVVVIHALIFVDMTL